MTVQDEIELVAFIAKGDRRAFLLIHDPYASHKIEWQGLSPLGEGERHLKSSVAKDDRQGNYALRSSMIRSVTNRAETMAVGTPVPGWVLAPTKYKFW